MATLGKSHAMVCTIQFAAFHIVKSARGFYSLFLICVSLVLPVHNYRKPFLCFGTLYIHVHMPLSPLEQVNVNLHYSSLNLINSPGFPKSLECYLSQSVNTSYVVDIITSHNLVALFQASFHSGLHACPCVIVSTCKL